MIERTISNSTPEDCIVTQLTESNPVLDEFWPRLEIPIYWQRRTQTL